MMRFLVALLLLFGCATVICAQRNEGANAPMRPGGLGPGIGTALPRSDEQWNTHSVTGKLVEVNVANHFVVVQLKNSPATEFLITEKTRKTADKKTELAGRKDLTLADYQPGYTVKITFRRGEDSKALEIRLKRPAK
jgi:hypothetical protein